MKPREKVVSAHDVESSLYYCHLAGYMDAELLSEGLDEEQPEVESRNNGSRDDNTIIYPPNTYNQPPLMSPSTLPPRQVMSIYHSQSSAPLDSDAQTKQRIPRKPVEKRPQIILPELTRRPVPKQKILGPRPIHQPHGSALQPSLNKQNLADETPSSGMQDPKDSLDNGEDEMRLREALQSMSLHRADASNDRHITLIRRDPATGDQWNVGKISLGQAGSPPSPNKSPKRRKRDIILEVFAPGYAKFEEPSGRGLSPFFRRLDPMSSGSNRSGQSFTQSPGSPSKHSLGFMSPWQTSCGFSTTASGRVLKCHHTLPETLLTPSARAASSGRLPSILVSELRFNLPSLVERKMEKKKENRRPLSYSSHSFGRSSFSSSILSPSPGFSANRQDSSENERTRNPRLPPRPLSYQDISRTKPTLPSRPGNHFADSYHQRSQSYEFDDEDGSSEHELDLSLGQERAGGGFSGNKAKLGKLVIYGAQGLAMLDLLVSANMGVWFRDILEL